MTNERIGWTGRVAEWAARWYLKKPDQADLLRIKFPDATSIGHAALNEAAFRLRSPRSARLTTLNVEITNRCNLKCVYCPVNRSLARPRTDLPFDLFRSILDRTRSIRTLLPFQWGEPLLHPRIFDMIRLASDRAVRTYVTTNGTFLDEATQRAILASGLTRLTISVDGNDEIHERTRGVALAPIRERVAELRRRRDAAGSAMRIDASMVVDETTEVGLDEFRAAWTPIVDRVQAIPRLLPSPRSSPCREPWRGLLVVLADGRVTTCCADAEGALALGDIREEDPAQIFNGPRMQELRRAHVRREFPDVCRNCGEFQHDTVHPRFR